MEMVDHSRDDLNGSVKRREFDVEYPCEVLG